MRRALFASLLLLPLLSLGGCGLTPVYGGGAASGAASLMRDIAVRPIEGKAGWLVRHAIEDRLSIAGSGNGTAPRYRLDIKLDDKVDAFGVRSDDAVTRERRTLRARYQLVDTSTGAVMLDQTAASDAGIDVVGSGYATIAAEDSALERLAQQIADQIVGRLALYARRAPQTAPVPPAPAVR